MTDQLIDQRGPIQKSISRIEVERAWADSVGAADWYERCQLWKGGGGIDKRIIDEARENMLLATDYAERLQALYDEQQDDLHAKRVMLVNVNGQQRIAPAWCKHENVVNVMPGSASGEPWDEPEPFAQCLDCGATRGDNGEWVSQ
jgi:hypothetical protein